MPHRSSFRVVLAPVLAPVLAAGLASVLVAGLAPARAWATEVPAARTAHTQAGRPAVLLGAAGNLAGLVRSVTLNGQAYEIPAAAYPYLGRGLSLNLFELTALQRMEHGGRLPVRIRYQGLPHALPGVTITHSGDGTAQGYLTAASARTFGAALDRLFVADHARGSYGSDGLFAGRTSISLAGTPPAARAPVRPGYPMHTLTITAANLAGQPDTGDFITVAAACAMGPGCSMFDETSFFYHGVAKFSVPAGSYFAYAEFDNLTSRGLLTSARVVVLPALTVSRAMTVHAAERTAQRIAMVTPRPATAQNTLLALVSKTHGAGSAVTTYGVTWDTHGPLWVNQPDGPPAGSLEVVEAQALGSPAAAHGSYEYELIHGRTLNAATKGSVDPRYVVRAQDLATVTARYYQDGPAGAVGLALPLLPGEIQAAPEPLVYPVHLPGVQTQYVTGNPSVLWFGGYSQAVSPVNFASSGAGQLSTGSSYRAGERTTVDWDAYPLSTQPVSYAPGVPALYQRDGFLNDVSVGRIGKWLTFDLAPFSDGQTAHYGTGLAVGSFGKLAGSLTVDADGKQVAHQTTAPGSDPFFADPVVLHDLSGTITARFDIARTGRDFRLSTASRTTWTWRSAPAPKVTLPAGWQCPLSITFAGQAGAPAAPDGGPRQRCAPQPVLMPSYSVAGLELTGSAPPGRQVLRLRVGYPQLSHGSRVTAAGLQVSYDGGRTWRTAHLTGQAGNYRASYPAPAGRQVTLRLSAANAAGGSVSQTIVNAYRVAGGPAALGPVHEACGPAPAGDARCFALYAAQNQVNAAITARAAGLAVPAPAAEPRGLSAADIESAYRLPIARGRRQTVAVVDAYSTPKLAADLAVYRRHYGLPPCPQTGGCLRIVNQAGHKSPLPRADVTGWGAEETLDVSMVSAACPRCRILVVEATTPSGRNLAIAEDTAIRLGATVVSNSYGQPENGLTQTFARYYRHPGHTIVVASGDGGFGPANFPANLASVTAVGGTTLTPAGNARGWAEKAWNAGGAATASGCSAYVPKPRWQHDPRCPGRTVADVAAVAADVAIYDSSIPRRYGGPWFVAAGTSAASPVVAAVYALAGNASTLPVGAEYAHPGDLFDVTEGNNVNGIYCGHDYLCTAEKGYDAPTGLGTPDGTGDF